jgi:hypothetical protein
MKFQELLHDVDIAAVRAAIDAGQHIDLGPLQEEFAAKLAALNIKPLNTDRNQRAVAFARGIPLATLFGQSYACADELTHLTRSLHDALYPDTPHLLEKGYTHAAHCPPSKKMDIGPVPHTDGEGSRTPGIQVFYATDGPGVIMYEGGWHVLNQIDDIYAMQMRQTRGDAKEAARGVIDWFEGTTGLTHKRTRSGNFIVAPNGVVHSAPWLYGQARGATENRKVYTVTASGFVPPTAG